MHYLYLHLRYLHSGTYGCSSWFKTHIIDRRSPSDNNTAQHRGAIKAVQYPKHQVLPKLTQGQRQTELKPRTQTLSCFLYHFIHPQQLLLNVDFNTSYF